MVGDQRYLTVNLCTWSLISAKTLGADGFGLILIHSGLACLLWLNVMSFDVWRTFRKFQPVNSEDGKTATFVQYSLYAWGLPGLFIWIGWGLCGWPLLTVGSPIVSLRLSLPILGIFICNTYFYITTALKIKQRKKETAQIIDGASVHRKKNEQWFNLYLKLFIIMGCPMILWAIGFAFNSLISFMLVFSLEPLQATCVFCMFVWKDDVKRSICEQFAEMMRRLGCCRRRDSTSDVQNGIEEL